MRVLMVSYEYPPVGGGAGQVTYALALEMARQGLGVEVLTAHYPPAGPCAPTPGAQLHPVTVTRAGIHQVGAQGLLSFWVKGCLRMRQLLRTGSYDVVHYSCSVPSGVLVLGQARSLPYIVSLHGIDVPGFMPDEFPLFQTLMWPLNRWIWRRSAAITAVSQTLKERAEWCAPEITCHVIPNGVDVTKFRANSKKQGGDVVRLICVARLVKFKRVHLLLEAFRGLYQKHRATISLTIVGDGYERPNLERLSRQLGIEEAVQFYRYCPHDQLPDLLHEADIFVLPSVSESFGIVFVEAMASGLPVVAARSGGAPEVVVDGVTGVLVEPESVEALESALDELIRDPVQRRAFGQRGWERVEKELSWSVIAQKYINLYQQVASKC